MLESVFLMLLGMGFILFVLGIFEESIIFAATSILMWIIILAAHLYVEVPADTYYTEGSMVPLSLAFIFINLIWIIILQMDLKIGRRLP